MDKTDIGWNCLSKRPPVTVDTTEWVLLVSSILVDFVAKSWPNDLEDIGQSKTSLQESHLLMLVIMCANPLLWKGSPLPPPHEQTVPQDNRLEGCIIFYCKGGLYCNSLAPGKFKWYFWYLTFQIILVIDGWGIFCELALRWLTLDLTYD